jgi:glycosyltransferase involved in cell wall biosynthesis
MKKIVFLVAHLLRGGAENTVVYLSEYFAKRGNDVYIISVSPHVEFDLYEKVKLICFDYENEDKILKRAAILGRRIHAVRKQIKEISPDIVVCMKYAMARYIISWHFKKKFVLVVSERSNPAYLTSLEKKFERYYIMKHSDGIVFQTKRAQSFFSDTINKKSVIIQNAIGNKKIYNADVAPFIKKEIVAVGNLRRQKDYTTLIKAFSIVYNRHSDYRLVIYGDGEERDKLRQLSSELNVESAVVFKGSVKDAVMYAYGARCYVLSSISEGMPNSLIEAMALGLPCVSTDCPNGPSELITNGVNGILVEPKNYNQLAEAIIKFIEDDEFAKKCGRNASAIKKTNSIEQIGNLYNEYFIKLYKEK